jgi:REP element-mobilizing transposase RayT
MPRQSRLDAPGTLHHVMGRGIETSKIFRTIKDREDFIDRLAELCRSGSWSVYAWALMPNHFHLLVRTGKEPLARSMRRLMSGYARPSLPEPLQVDRLSGRPLTSGTNPLYPFESPPGRTGPGPRGGRPVSLGRPLGPDGLGGAGLAGYRHDPRIFCR